MKQLTATAVRAASLAGVRNAPLDLLTAALAAALYVALNVEVPT